VNGEFGIPQAVLWSLCALFYAMGGFVKGTMGVGLPLVVVPTLSLIMPAPQAMGMMVVPVLASNIWQAIEVGNFRESFRRFGGLIVVMIVITLLTVKFSAGLSVANLNLLVGISLLVAVAWMGLKPNVQVPPRFENLTSNVVGALAGLMGGLSSLSGPFVITLLMALKLSREQFIGCISIIYLAGSFPMYGAMVWYERFGWTEVGLSALGLAPMFLGIRIGKALRHRLSEELFRKLLLIYLFVLAIVLTLK
jgi:uncharacterized membrane protein YfcA